MQERLLPWPRVQHQKAQTHWGKLRLQFQATGATSQAVTLKCLEGFINSFSELAANVLPSGLSL